MLERIVSGGQTGVDRAALDVAMELGLPVGGWCPAGRRAEDGRISDRYPLIETESRNYAVRTRLNVRDSDGTLILSPVPLSGGTGLTRDLAGSAGKPCLVIDLEMSENAPERFAEWLADNRIRTLNVAGPRGGNDPSVYESAVELLRRLLAPVAG